MNRLQKLQRLTDYLTTFRMKVFEDCKEVYIRPMMTTAQSDATSKLAHQSGVQVLFARPECDQQGNSDYHMDTVATIVFVLEKILGPDIAPDLENSQYSRLLLIADSILGKISDDTSGDNCNLMTGLSLSSVNIVPEASLFGGWSGFSLELTFE